MWVSLGSFVEAEGSNWHQNPPLRVCMYVCEKECVMSPYSLVVRAPLQFIPGSFSMGNLPLSLPPTNFAALFLPHPLRARSHDVFVSTVDKTGSSLGPPISPPPWGDMADEWRDPQTVHAYNLSLPFGGRPVIATQIAPCFQKDLLLYLKAWPTAPKRKKKKKGEHRLHGSHFCQENEMEHVPLVGRHPGGYRGWVFGGGREG